MRPTPNDVHGVWLDRVQIDHSIDAHDIDVIRALCEVCERPLTVARLFELLQGEQNETVRRGLVEVIRQRAARGEGREVAECYVRLMVRRGARELTAERVQKAVGVSLRIAGEALSACGGVEVREVVDGRRVRVYRFDQVECELVSDGVQSDQVECELVSDGVQSDQVECELVSDGVQSDQVECELVSDGVQSDQVECELVSDGVQSDQVECELVSDGETCDHNLLRAVAALVGQPRVLLHAAARLASTSRERALCAACDEIRRMLVLVRDEASAAACGARARGLLAQVARAEGARQEQPDQYRLDGLYTERELGWIPHILEFVESRKRVLPFYVALHLRDKLRLSRKEMQAVQDLVWRMASSGDAGLRLVGAMVERAPLAREEAG